MTISSLFAQLVLLVAVATTAAAFQQQQALPSHTVRPLQVVKPAALSSNKRYNPSLITLATATLASSIELQSSAPRCPFSFAHVQARFASDVRSTNAIPNRSSTNGALVLFLQTAFFNMKRRITKPIISSLFVYWNLKLRGKVPTKIANIARKADVDDESAEYIDTMYRLLRNKRRFLFVGGHHHETTIGEKLHYVSRVLAQEFSTLQTHMMVPTTHPEFSQDYQDVTNRFWEHKNGMKYEDFLLEPQTVVQSLGAVHDLVSQFQINVAAAMSNQYTFPKQLEGVGENSNFRSTLVFKKMAAIHSRMGIQRKDFDSLCNAVHVVMHRVLEDATSKSIISNERKEELVDFFVKRFGNEFTLAFCVA